jgi:hypothetical protein
MPDLSSTITAVVLHALVSQEPTLGLQTTNDRVIGASGG